MEWKVEVTTVFAAWVETLSHEQKVDVEGAVYLLQQRGPRLSRPHADTLKGSRHSNLKELRIQSQGKPLRALFAFDPQRTAIILIGGDKTGDSRFYDRMIPLADALFDDHLKVLKRKGSK